MFSLCCRWLGVAFDLRWALTDTFVAFMFSSVLICLSLCQQDKDKQDFGQGKVDKMSTQMDRDQDTGMFLLALT